MLSRFKFSTTLNRLTGRPAFLALSCVALAFIAISMPIVFSQPVRRAYVQMLDRQIAKRVPPDFVFVGDSLMANANWGWMLSKNPLSAVNLAEPGATIAEVSVQVTKAGVYHAPFLVLLVGTNDLRTYNRPFNQIVCSYTSLLENVPTKQQLIVTLIPYTSFSQDTEKISALNAEIAKLSVRHNAIIIDLNPYIASKGILLPGFTTDGLHLNRHAYQIWAEQLLFSVK
jgi:lysophospholipase L1-like esterase